MANSAKHERDSTPTASTDGSSIKHSRRPRVAHNIDDLIKTLKIARQTSTPLVAVRNADPASTLDALRRVLGATWDRTAVISWDIMRGAIGFSRAGKEHVPQLLNGIDPSILGPA